MAIEAWILLGLIAGASRNPYAQEPWLLATILHVGFCAFCMMMRDIVVARVSRMWAAGLLAASILYAVANVGIFIITICIDRYFIFDSIYLAFAVGVLPTLAISLVFFVAGASQQCDWLGVVGFITAIANVAFAHFLVIAICGASV